jgi:pimeloyl-[acyl-carrier protein] methyl ester esterase
MKVLFVGGWAHTAEAYLNIDFKRILGERPEINFETIDPHALLACSAPTTAAEQLAPRIDPETVLSGWSLGAFLCLDYVLNFSQSVKGLILLSGGLRFCGLPDGFKQSNVRALAKQLSFERTTVLRKFYSDCGYSELEIRQRLEEAEQLSDSDLLRWLEYLQQVDFRKCTPVTSPPIVAVHGKHDRIIPVSAINELASVLITAETIVLDTAPHYVFNDSGLGGLIDAFIQKLEH